MKHLILCSLIALPLFSTGIVAKPTEANLSITLNSSDLGRNYDGVGGLMSYAKLLYDYPEPQRSEILDYLFLPNYGASLQMLKIQIGYDGSRTTSSWPCHWRDQYAPNYQRGYGWWLFKEARKRNPGIMLTALHWGYPAWIITNEQKAEFVYDFVRGAYEEHGILLDFIGGNQNESAVTKDITKKIKQKLLASPVLKNVKVVAADEGSQTTKFNVISNLQSDASYANAVDIIGVHYKSRSGNDPILNGAFDLGKPVWSTEDGGGMYNSNTHAFQWIDQLMKLFVDVKITGVMRFLVTAAAYDNMPWPNFALIKTKEPWSGNYILGANAWAMAHFTQFVKPGWKMFNVENPFIYTNTTDTGRFVAYRSPDTNDYSVIVRTNDNFPAEGVNFELSLSEDIAGKNIYVWRSDFNDIDQANWFVHTNTVTPQNGKATVHLDKGCVYTLTTTTGQMKGTSSIPSTAVLSFPYADDFESYQVEQLARYFVNVNSSFEVAPAGTGIPGQLLRQVVSAAPPLWHPNDDNIGQPLTEIGDMRWTDYAVKIDALLENEGALFLGGRFDQKTENTGDYFMEGYYLSLDNTGYWQVLRKDAANTEFVQLSSGTVSGFGLNKWTSLALSFKGNSIKAFIDGRQVSSVTDNTYTKGNVVIGTKHHDVTNFFVQTPMYVTAQFDNLLIDSEYVSSTDDAVFAKPFEITVMGHNKFKITVNDSQLHEINIYNQVGQKILCSSVITCETIEIPASGLLFVVVDGYTEKLLLK